MRIETETETETAEEYSGWKDHDWKQHFRGVAGALRCVVDP